MAGAQAAESARSTVGTWVRRSPCSGAGTRGRGAASKSPRWRGGRRTCRAPRPAPSAPSRAMSMTGRSPVTASVLRAVHEEGHGEVAVFRRAGGERCGRSPPRRADHGLGTDRTAAPRSRSVAVHLAGQRDAAGVQRLELAADARRRGGGSVRLRDRVRASASAFQHAACGRACSARAVVPLGVGEACPQRRSWSTSWGARSSEQAQTRRRRASSAGPG